MWKSLLSKKGNYKFIIVIISFRPWCEQVFKVSTKWKFTPYRTKSFLTFFYFNQLPSDVHHNTEEKNLSLLHCGTFCRMETFIFRCSEKKSRLFNTHTFCDNMKKIVVLTTKQLALITMYNQASYFILTLPSCEPSLNACLLLRVKL